MFELSIKRVIGISLVLLATVLLWSLQNRLNHQLDFSTEYTGWILASCVLLLMGYNIRKRVPFLPLMDNRIWMQIHIYIGFFTAIVFFFHMTDSWPHGEFEQWLAIGFVCVVMSGFTGLILYRVIPPLLSIHDESVIYERIPALRWQIKKQIDDLVQRSIEEENSTTIADFYRRRLLGFIMTRSVPFSYFSGVHQTIQVWEGRFNTMKRYLNKNEQILFNEIIELTNQKIELDYQYVTQRMMKAWLYIHVPLTLSLLILISLHILIVYAYL